MACSLPWSGQSMAPLLGYSCTKRLYLGQPREEGETRAINHYVGTCWHCQCLFPCLWLGLSSEAGTGGEVFWGSGRVLLQLSTAMLVSYFNDFKCCTFQTLYPSVCLRQQLVHIAGSSMLRLPCPVSGSSEVLKMTCPGVQVTAEKTKREDKFWSEIDFVGVSKQILIPPVSSANRTKTGLT